MHILFGLGDTPDTTAARLLARALPDSDSVRPASDGDRTRPGSRSAGGASRDSSTPTLDQYGRDLTQAAREGLLDPVVGRDDEVEQTLEVLSRARRTTRC